jgi:hypothetical protein
MEKSILEMVGGEKYLHYDVNNKVTKEYTTLQERIEQLEKEKCELLGIIQGKDKVIKELEEESDFFHIEKGKYKSDFLQEAKNNIKLNRQLIKAKEIIRDFLSVAIDYIDKEDKNYSFIAEAEQFLKED